MAIFSIEPRIRAPKPNARLGLGLLALGALITGAPALAAADAPARKQCGPACQQHQRLFAKLAGTAGSAPTAISVPPTATSALALLAPAALPAPASTLIVTTAADVTNPGDGKLSLREAVAQANATTALDAIGFAPSLEGQTLVLTGGQLTVSQDLVIDGNGDDGGAAVNIDAARKSRVLLIGGTATDVVLRDLGITGGYGPEDGGGIRLGAGNSLQLTAVVVRGNDAGGYFSGYGSGGGIAADANSRLTVTGSTITDNSSYGDDDCGGGISAGGGSAVAITDSAVKGNWGSGYHYGSGGGICAGGSTIIERSTIAGNGAGGFAGGILAGGPLLTISDSTISGNNSGEAHSGGGYGGGIVGSGAFTLTNTTVTGNISYGYSSPTSGAGIYIYNDGTLSACNSIVAGNFSLTSVRTNDDIDGAIAFSNGHNVFSSDVVGNDPGDRENVAAATVFAAIDPATGGGALSPEGNVPPKDSPDNPALSGADPLSAGARAQLGGPRPSPAGSLPDIGAAEIDQPLSTSPTVNNDVITGSNAANNLSGLAGNDLLRGLGGNDTLNGGPGSDVLDGGPGNNKLNGGSGVDLASFAFSPVAVAIDLSGTTDTARRGGATDTLTSIEGAIGTAKADSFKGDAADNEFQGGLGKDTMTGGGGRDTWDFNATADSPASASRDVIKDFAPGQDVIDLAGIDADATLPGDQSFRWVGKAVLTGAAQLGYYVSGGNTTIRASTDADAAAEFSIRLTGVKTLTETDFRP